MIGEKYIGKFKLVSQENFEEFLKAIGLKWAWRAVAKAATTVHSCSIDETTGVWTVETRMLLRENFAVFQLDKEIVHQTLDGRTIKLITVAIGDTTTNDYHLEHTEKWDNDTKEAKYVHEIDGDDWTTTIIVGNVKCVRKYKRIV